MNIILEHLKHLYFHSNQLNSHNIIDLLIESGLGPIDMYFMCKYNKKENNEDIYYILRNKYLDINWNNLFLLKDSCKRNDLEAVKIILYERNGLVNPNLDGNDRYSYLMPLGLAMNRNNLDMVKCLLDKGAYVTEADISHGSTSVKILNYVKQYVENNNIKVLRTGPARNIIK